MAVFVKNFQLVLSLLSLLTSVCSWKTCEQTFCKRVRNSPDGYEVRYSVDQGTVKLVNGIVEGNLITDPATTKLTFRLAAFTGSLFHLVIDESVPTAPRYREEKALNKDNFPALISLAQRNIDDEGITLQSANLKVVIYWKPFKVEFYNNDRLISIANAKDRLVFETEDDTAAVALDVSFPGAQRAYGIPEHADRLALHTTAAIDPYRQFNVDYSKYAIQSTESLYGAIPVFYAHAVTHTSGVFWLNAAQTWVDTVVAPNQVDAFFMSESGVLEMFVLAGPSLSDTVKQYAALTGVAPLPQYFTLGYHQSRYSYMTQREVTEVVKNFDKNDLPLDVVWLDIDYTDDKKYFTWNPENFKDPGALLNELAATNRKLVAIIDPHIKIEEGYFLHDEATDKGYYVRSPAGDSNYEGISWPGSSSYLDFFNPDALNYYASLYSSHHFQGKNIHVWNDMNEPSIFETPDSENTMPLDLIHHGGWKHRDVHNAYGLYQTIGTRQGLLERQPALRPFILTRSHFAGTQRYAAIWTGDNYATWDYLQISFPMCLTEALAGVSFCGADVGGFGGIPDDELFQRWYQAGAWLPFYRGHSSTDVPQREPYLYAQDIQVRIKTALRQRYGHLPLWYTLFWEHERNGEPVIRPITYHYSTESDVLSIDNQVLVGTNVLAAPVLEQGVTTVSVYLPGGESEVWYNIDDNYKQFNGTGYQLMHVNLNSVPVFYRGGGIITRKDMPRQTSVETYKDPFTIYICLDRNNEATGTLYVDDYESYKYKQLQYIYIGFAFAKNIISSHKIDTNPTYDGAANVTQIIIVNPPQNILAAKFIDNINDGSEMSVSYSKDRVTLTVANFSVSLQVPFKIQLINKDEPSSASILTLTNILSAILIACFVFV